MRRRRGMGGEEDDQSGEKLDLFSLIHRCRNPPPCISTASLLFTISRNWEIYMEIT
jgi:hypothetical protein